MFMRTQRLFLRPIFEEDWPEVLSCLGDFDVVRMLANAPWPYTEELARAHCQSVLAEGEIRLAITVPGKLGAPVIGNIGLRPNPSGVHQLGFWLGREWHRRGYGAEAVRGIVALADALGIPCIESGHYLENIASGKVLRSAGFVATGELSPTRCMARNGEVLLARRYRRQLPGAATMECPVAA
ncbi:MAG: GNAT family N-acetyltransferase [Erythrobacter sp.]|nr:MAG: GNAT family N-acetyltransferase [Erythrobacter sp.]